jgi:hypothetical protein
MMRAMTRLLVRRGDGLPSRLLAALSRGALDRPLRAPAELVVAVPSDHAVLLGAFQRAVEVVGSPAEAAHRGSGGAAAQVGAGTVWLQLALARTDALVPCDAPRLLNRYVRPLLRSLTRSGATARWFGRDWVSVETRPAALVAFAHDAGTGRALVEAVVAVATPFEVDKERASFRGAAPTTLGEITGRVDPHAVADAVAAAYAAAYEGAPDAYDPGALLEGGPGEPDGADARERRDPPWQATREEAIGLVGAGRDREGRLRIGGELMASRDAVLALEASLAALPAGADLVDAVGRAVDETLGSPPAATFGLRSLVTVRDVIVEALATPRS